MNRELQVSIHRGERLNAPGKDRASVPGEFEWGLAFGKNTIWGRFPLLDVERARLAVFRTEWCWWTWVCRRLCCRNRSTPGAENVAFPRKVRPRFRCDHL